MKSTLFSAAVMGALALSVSFSARAVEPVMSRVIVVHSDDVPAYAREIEALRALYKKQGFAVTIQAYEATHGEVLGANVLLMVEVSNLTTLARLDELNRTQPELVAQIKKMGVGQQLIFDGVSEKLTP